MSDHDSLSYPPRGFSRDEAARYVGISTTTFDKLVEDGRMPKPARIGKRTIWDRFKLDAAFSDLDHNDRENELDRALRLAGRRG